jgi:hypothetical protein
MRNIVETFSGTFGDFHTMFLDTDLNKWVIRAFYEGPPNDILDGEAHFKVILGMTEMHDGDILLHLADAEGTDSMDEVYESVNKHGVTFQLLSKFITSHGIEIRPADQGADEDDEEDDTESNCEECWSCGDCKEMEIDGCGLFCVCPECTAEDDNDYDFACDDDCDCDECVPEAICGCEFCQATRKLNRGELTQEEAITAFGEAMAALGTGILMHGVLSEVRERE